MIASSPIRLPSGTMRPDRRGPSGGCEWIPGRRYSVDRPSIGGPTTEDAARRHSPCRSRPLSFGQLSFGSADIDRQHCRCRDRNDHLPTLLFGRGLLPEAAELHADGWMGHLRRLVPGLRHWTLQQVRGAAPAQLSDFRLRVAAIRSNACRQEPVRPLLGRRSRLSPAPRRAGLLGLWRESRLPEREPVRLRARLPPLLPVGEVVQRLALAEHEESAVQASRHRRLGLRWPNAPSRRLLSTGLTGASRWPDAGSRTGPRSNPRPRS